MKEKKEAISGTVTGKDQHVGFRAMIMKQAIEYNLAGFTKNLPNDVVNFTLHVRTPGGDVLTCPAP